MLFKKTDKKVTDHDPDILSWQREDKGTFDTPLLYMFPEPGDNIKDKRYFAVKDYERALFFNKGEMMDVLEGGVYELEKEARIKGTEIVWVDRSLIDVPWGIAKTQGIPTKEGCFVGLHGDLKLRISNVKTFYYDVVSGKKQWTIKDLKDWIMSLLHTSLRDIFKKYGVKQILLEERERVINLVTAKVTEEFLKYGLELEAFNIIGVKTPEDIQELMDQEKLKTKSIAGLCNESLESLIERKKVFEARIKELEDKQKALQDQLLDDEITQDMYERKKDQIGVFIAEAQEQLTQVDEQISKL